MKRLISILLTLCLCFSLFGCGSDKKEKQAMEGTVQNLVTQISEGDFSQLDTVFVSIPDALSTFIEKMSFNEDSDSAVVLKLQEIIRSNAKNISCEIDSEQTTYDKSNGTGEVYATLKYGNLEASAIESVEKILSSTVSNVLAQITGKDTEAIESTLNDIFVNSTPEIEEMPVKFSLVKQDGNWMIKDTDSALIDLVSGNTFGSFSKLVDLLK